MSTLLGVVALMGTPGSGPLDTQTVTVGNGLGGFGYGFSTTYGFGSVSDGTFNAASGAAITELYAVFSTDYTLIFKATGAPNSGWTKMNVGGADYLRASASYGAGQWSWTGIAVNPFASSPATVTFT